MNAKKPYFSEAPHYASARRRHAGCSKLLLCVTSLLRSTLSANVADVGSISASQQAERYDLQRRYGGIQQDVLGLLSVHTCVFGLGFFLYSAW